MFESQRSRNTAIFGHRFCKSRAPFSRSHGVRRTRSLPSNLANLLSACLLLLLLLLLPLPSRSFLPSIAAVQISQADFILVSRIFFIAPDPGALSPPSFCFLPRLHTYVIERRQQCICVRYKERRLTSEAPCSGSYLLDSLHAARFSWSR